MNLNSPNERRVQRLRAKFKEETAQLVLAAAEEVFAESGTGASMAEIAKHAGVAVGTLYNHFGDREHLLNALLDQTRKELLDAIDDRLKRLAKAAFTDQLVALVTEIFDHVESHRRLFTVLMDEERLNSKSEFARALYVRVEKVIKKGIKERFLRESGSDLYPALLLGMLRGAKMGQVYGGPSLSPGECVGRVVELFLHGARRPHGAP